MKMEMLIDELQEVVDSAFALPLSGGKMVVNVERLKDIISEMKANIPQEIRQAKNIVADRTKILSDAKKEAENIVQVAEARAKELTDRHEITRNAQQSADDILSKANEEAEKIRSAASARRSPAGSLSAVRTRGTPRAAPLCRSGSDSPRSGG